MSITLDAGENFDEVLAKQQLPVIVDFWAPWCGPCRMLSPELEGAVEDLKNKVQVLKVNIDDFAELASSRYKVMGVPTLVLFKDGKEQDRVVGYRSRAALKDFINKHLPQNPS
jgi:thioredoxin 1